MFYILLWFTLLPLTPVINIELVMLSDKVEVKIHFFSPCKCEYPTDLVPFIEKPTFPCYIVGQVFTIFHIIVPMWICFWILFCSICQYSILASLLHSLITIFLNNIVVWFKFFIIL